MSQTQDGQVTLREITKQTLDPILELAVAESQRDQVAPNADSIAEAHFEPRAWFRGIYAGDTPVGFVMLYLDRETPKYDLWRFMVDHRHQGRGYGTAALQQVIDYVRTLPGATTLLLSYVPGDASPRPFYMKNGFADSGEMDGAEKVMSLAL